MEVKLGRTDCACLIGLTSEGYCTGHFRHATHQATVRRRNQHRSDQRAPKPRSKRFIPPDILTTDDDGYAQTPEESGAQAQPFHFVLMFQFSLYDNRITGVA